MSEVASELAFLRREITRLNRKLALARLPGKVKEVKSEEGDWRVCLDMGEDPETGDKVLSPWVRVQPASAGALKIKVRPSEGEQMYLMSASGVVGADSVAMWGAFDQDHPAPAGDEDVIFERGNARLTIEDGKILAKVDGVTLTLAEGKATVASGDASLVVENGKITAKAGEIIADGKVKAGGPNPTRRALREDLTPAEKVYVE